MFTFWNHAIYNKLVLFETSLNLALDWYYFHQINHKYIVHSNLITYTYEIMEI